MINYIVGRIEQAYDSSPEEGIAKYEAYFINTKLYKKFRDGVDELLIKDGYSDVVPVKGTLI